MTLQPRSDRKTSSERAYAVSRRFDLCHLKSQKARISSIPPISEAQIYPPHRRMELGIRGRRRAVQGVRAIRHTTPMSFLTWALIAYVTAAAASPARRAPNPFVVLGNATIIGVTNGTTSQFLGIPFAQPP